MKRQERDSELDLGFLRNKRPSGGRERERDKVCGWENKNERGITFCVPASFHIYVLSRFQTDTIRPYVSV